VVIGIDADEAEYLADFLDRDECVQRVQIPQQQVRRAEPPPEGTGEHARPALLGAPLSFSVGRHAPDQVREVATSWSSGALVSWPARRPISSPRGRRTRRRLLISRLPAHSLPLVFYALRSRTLPWRVQLALAEAGSQLCPSIR